MQTRLWIFIGLLAVCNPVFSDPYAKSKILAEALAKHDERIVRSVFRGRFGDEQSLRVANNLAEALSRHRGSLGTNKILKSYAIPDNSWLVGQILFKETTLFYEIRAIGGVVYDLEVGSGPDVFKSTLLYDSFTEVDSKSDLVEAVFANSQTLKDLHINLFKSSNLVNEVKLPDGSENIILTDLNNVTSFEIGHRYLRHMYLIKASAGVTATCNIDIYRTMRGEELVNGYSCDDLLQK